MCSSVEWKLIQASVPGLALPHEPCLEVVPKKHLSLCPSPWLLNSGAIDILGRLILSWADCSMHGRISSNIPGFHPLNASSTPSPQLRQLILLVLPGKAHSVPAASSYFSPGPAGAPDQVSQYHLRHQNSFVFENTCNTDVPEISHYSSLSFLTNMQIAMV